MANIDYYQKSKNAYFNEVELRYWNRLFLTPSVKAAYEFALRLRGGEVNICTLKK